MEEVLGVIGGTGLYEVGGLDQVERVRASTPYGEPSDELVSARFQSSGARVLFLPRHGRGHRIPPHAINYRANVCALKKLGATQILSVSAVGSMQEHIAPGDVVVVDQFIDLTRRRIGTFFEPEAAAHVAFAEPICPLLAEAVHGAAKQCAAAGEAPGAVHRGGTYLCIEGPQFSTRAESRLYRSWNVDVIGMTNMPEAKLAREAELPYATLALATDYDCWHAGEEAVDVEAILARLASLVELAKRVVLRLGEKLPALDTSPARTALRGAVMTAVDCMTARTRADLSWVLPGA
ncbi:MAG: S-methyl-5'-thioadenosine phosphorylase [Deltaproteobacteria bacterium]|nr:S-methyl-5'-thioadenosine phosphorylase [Deltaproteobacteria bacterium]